MTEQKNHSIASFYDHNYIPIDKAALLSGLAKDRILAGVKAEKVACYHQTTLGSQSWMTFVNMHEVLILAREQARYIRLEQAAELAGRSVKYLRRLARIGRIRSQEHTLTHPLLVHIDDARGLKKPKPHEQVWSLTKRFENAQNQLRVLSAANMDLGHKLAGEQGRVDALRLSMDHTTGLLRAARALSEKRLGWIEQSEKIIASQRLALSALEKLNPAELLLWWGKRCFDSVFGGIA